MRVVYRAHRPDRTQLISQVVLKHRCGTYGGFRWILVPLERKGYDQYTSG